MARFPEAKTSEVWRVSTESNVVANDISKDFVVPADTEWQVMWVFVKLVSSATAGNRQMALQILAADGTTVIGEVRGGAVQAAGATRYYQFGNVSHDSAFRDTDYLGVGMGQLPLAAGQTLRVLVKSGGDAAADDMDVHVTLISRDV
jgi:hypothetical protein